MPEGFSPPGVPHPGPGLLFFPKSESGPESPQVVSFTPEAGAATGDAGLFAFAADYRQTYPTMSNAYTFNPQNDTGYVTVTSFTMLLSVFPESQATTGGTPIYLVNGDPRTMTFS
jgi:hypothetical protein